MQTIRTWHPSIVVEILYADGYDEAPPVVQQRIDSVRRIFDDLGYELTPISCAGGCDYLGLYAGSAPAS